MELNVQNLLKLNLKRHTIKQPKNEKNIYSVLILIKHASGRNLISTLNTICVCECVCVDKCTHMLERRTYFYMQAQIRYKRISSDGIKLMYKM